MESRPMQTTEADLLVSPKKGVSIGYWLEYHEVRSMNRTVTYKGRTDEGKHLVTVTYTARGADFSDIMRPYRNTIAWLSLATVEKAGPTRRIHHHD